jgi:hypothetical protein
MANQLPQPGPETQPHTVLRPIFMAGLRVEVGEVVQLNRQQARELANAGKVSVQPAAADMVPPKARPKAPPRNLAG